MAELRFSCVADHSTCYSAISSLLLDSSGSWYRLDAGSRCPAERVVVYVEVASGRVSRSWRKGLI